MQALIAPRGLIVDLITPLNSDGTIDGRGLEKLLDRTASDAQGLFLASPNMGEGKNLVLDQRLDLLQKTLVVIRGRIPIFIWVTQDTEEKTTETILGLNEARARQKNGGQIFWVDSPLCYHSNRGLPDHYSNICLMVDGPFILHNDPELIKGLGKPIKRNNIRTAIVKELTHLEKIVGLIFSGSLDRAHNYHRACRNRDHFRIYDGDENNFLNHPSTSGAVSMGANIASKAWRRVAQSSLQLTGDQEDYPDSLRQIWELGRYLRTLNEFYHPMPVAIIKGVLSDMGIIETPTCTFTAEDVEEPKQKIKELMAQYGEYPEKK